MKKKMLAFIAFILMPAAISGQPDLLPGYIIRNDGNIQHGQLVHRSGYQASVWFSPL